MSLARSILFPTLLSFLSSCAEELPPSHPRITFGQAADARTSSAVALLKRDHKGDFYTYCTGVLLGSQQLLTAAHCSREREQVIKLDDVRVAVSTAQPDQEQEHLEPVAAITLHPNYDPQKMLPDEDGLLRPSEAHDLAIWTLEKPLQDAAVAQILAPDAVDSSLTPDAAFTLMGYGVSSPWEGLSSPLLRRAETRFQPEVQLSVIKQVLVEGRLVKRIFTYDVAARSNFEFYLGAKTLPDTCKGDSGGPVYTADMRLIGLTSRGDRACVQGGVYTLLPAYSTWINEQLHAQ